MEEIKENNVVILSSDKATILDEERLLRTGNRYVFNLDFHISEPYGTTFNYRKSFIHLALVYRLRRFFFQCE